MSKKELTTEIYSKILLIRGKKVMIDRDLADLYGVNTKRLNEQVKRNISRFPEDFMFQLNKEEKDEVVANCDHLNNLKYSSSLPFVFTEHGAIMAASVLNTISAIEMSVFIVKAFVAMRDLLSKHKAIENKINELEKTVSNHDDSIKSIVTAIRGLMEVPVKKKNKIGFKQTD